MSVESPNFSAEIAEEENQEENLEEEKRKKTFSLLEKNDYLEFSPEGKIICDLEKFNSYNSMKEPFLTNAFGHGGTGLLQEVFSGQKVISKEDWEAGEKEGKSLYYDPASDEEALNQTAIKQADFYFIPWKLGRKIKYPHLETVSKIEATTAVLLYHPNYGNGFRDEQGQLKVKNTQRKYEKFKTDFFSQYHFSPKFKTKRGTYSPFSGNVGPFLRTTGNHLVESGLLTVKDIKQQKIRGEKIAPLETKIIKNGRIFLDGVAYFLSKKLNSFEVVALNEKMAVIKNPQDGQIVSHFPLRPDLKPEKARDFSTLNAKEVNLQPFDREAFDQKMVDEDEEDYHQRTESLRELEMKSIRTENLIPKDKQRMKEISLKNWSQIDNPELGAKISSDFTEFLDQNQPSRFYLAQVNNELTGFIRFQDISDREVYAGSLNIDSHSRGAQIGESLLKSCLQKEAEHKIVKATAYPKIPITSKYIGGFGFVGTGVTNYAETDVPFFQMEINQEKNLAYHYLKGDRQEALGYYNNNQYKPEDEIIVLRYNPNQEFNEMMATCGAVLSQGDRAMTAYFDDSQEKGYKYLVFEKNLP